METKEVTAEIGGQRRQLRVIQPISMAGKKFSGDGVEFANELFHRARPLRISIGKDKFFVFPSPHGGREDAVAVELLLGKELLRIGVGSLAQCGVMDKRLDCLALEIYPEDVQKMLLESLLDPFFVALEAWCGQSVTVKKVSMTPSTANETSLPFRFAFSLYGANPHGGKAVPLLLSGTIAMEKSAADRLLETLRGLPTVPYKFYGEIAQSCVNQVSSLKMQPSEIRSLRVGDVILLENGKEVSENCRCLKGLLPHAVDCRQDGQKMTIIRLRTETEPVP
ncbi:MAG: hypothetical protein LBS68_03565 [Puniceicoccales bacterium]|nr:hypothetical protein [Puniceicoccales bacterium]